ncbi:helix-turn-helix transcriptional regulator [soil metagenome]
MAKAATSETKTEEVTPSSGNVFADLGFADPEEELAKADLVIAIGRVIQEKRLTQTKAAKLTGIDQSTLSKLLRGRTSGFTMDRLIATLNSLDQDVEISIRPRPSDAARGARVSVSVIPVLS